LEERLNVTKKYKTSEILRESLKYLYSGRGDRIGYEYVCLCLAVTNIEGWIEVTRMISKRLGYSDLVIENGIEGWLCEQGIDVSKYSTKTVQDYRKRWVLSMIKEFEAKND
jgi:hypothetical protein